VVIFREVSPWGVKPGQLGCKSGAQPKTILLSYKFYKIKMIKKLSRWVFLYREKYLTLPSNRFPLPSTQISRYQINCMQSQSIIFAIRFSISFLLLTSKFFLSFKANEPKFCMKTGWINTKILLLIDSKL